MENEVNNLSTIKTDSSINDKDLNNWSEDKGKKMQIYNIFGECILFLEDSLSSELDVSRKIFIKEEIGKLKKYQEVYYVPSLLEITACNGEKQEDKKLIKL